MIQHHLHLHVNIDATNNQGLLTTAAMTAIAESKDEEITTDDLQAMKAMIGDIKKDPSLLFRLTSLSIDANTLTASNACNRGNTASASNNNNTNNNGDVFIVDDDTNTVVSALTMPSVGDWTTGGYPQHQLPHHHTGAGVAGEGDRSHNIMERHPSSSPTFRMGRGQYQSSSTFAKATVTAVTRTNNDAEIALRMQSLRAQRSGTNGRRTEQSNSPQVTSNRIKQSTTTPLKTLPSISDEGRLLARTPSPTGGTRLKTNYSPGGIGTSTPTSSKRHQVSSTSCPLIMAADSVIEGNASGDKKPHGRSSRQRSRHKDVTGNIESENSHQAGALVLYERNDGCNDIDGGRKPEAPSSQVIVARSNRHGKQSTQLTSVPSNSLTQYHPLTPSPKSNKVGKDSTQRSVNSKNLQQPPFHESERSITQPSPSLSTSRRTSSRHISDRRRGAKNSTSSSTSTAVTASFSSSSPSLMASSALHKHSPTKFGISNTVELSYRRVQSVGRAGNERGGSSRDRSGLEVSSSQQLIAQDRKQSSSSSSHRNIHKVRYESPPFITHAASMLTPIASPGDGGRSSGESQLVDQNQPTPKSEAPSTITKQHPLSMSLQFTNEQFTGECRRWSLDEMNGSADEQKMEIASHHTKSKKTRARAETEPCSTTPVEDSTMPDKQDATEGKDQVSTLVNDHHVNDTHQVLLPQSPLPTSTSQSSLGYRLAQLSMLDRGSRHQSDQRSDRSESGRSVISRLFSPVKRTVSSHDEGWVGDGGISPMANLENDSVQSKSQSASVGLVNAVEDDNGRNRLAVPATVNNESSHQKIPEHRRYVSNEDVLLSDHAAAGTNSTRGPQFCDERGRCQLHPHIRLLKPKMFGGWKVLLQYCPDCVLEQLKKNQENLTRMQLQQKRDDDKKKRRSKREKERHQSRSKNQADPIIGKDVGDVEFTPYSEHVGKTKSGHHAKDNETHQEAASEDVRDKGKPIIIQQPHQEQASSSNSDKEEQVPPPPPSAAAAEASESLPLPSNDSIVPHQELNKKRVNGLPWIDYNGNSGRYTGAVNEQYLPNGQGVMIYDRGSISAGIWYNGVLDTEDSRSRSQVAMTSTSIPPPENEHTTAAPAKLLPNYTIGDTGRVEDMIIDTKKVTAALIAETRSGDAAFVCRTDGRWTYAIAKSRTYGDNAAIKFKVNIRGSTKEFPMSQWGGFVRPIRQPPRAANDGELTLTEQDDRTSAARAESRLQNSLSSLGNFLDSQNGSSSSVAGNFMRQDSDISISSVRSAPHMINDMSGGRQHRSMQNLTTAKMKIPSRSRSRSRSRQRKLSTSFPNLLSSDMSVSEENVDGQMNDVWETASGSGYRLRGIDP